MGNFIQRAQESLDRTRHGLMIPVLLVVAAMARAHGAELPRQEESRVTVLKQAQVEAPIAVGERRLELSGCAVVDGGVLVVEDELIGAVLCLSTANGGFSHTEMIKLERKKKASAPFTTASRLFPIQDFEDIASDGHETVYLVGSHQGKDGIRRPDREFLIQADWSARDHELKVVGEQYGLLTYIAPALQKADASIGLSALAVSDALNVEGLALHNGIIYLGLRAPRGPGGEALVLYGPAEDWMRGSGSPEVLALNLDGAGVRALDWDTKYDTLLLLSGSPEDGAREVQAALWHVDPPAGRPTQVVRFEDSVSRKHPEGICRLPEADNGKLLVVLDGEGGEEGGSVLHINW